MRVWELCSLATTLEDAGQPFPRGSLVAPLDSSPTRFLWKSATLSRPKCKPFNFIHVVSLTSLENKTELAEEPEGSVAAFLGRFPEYRKTLRLAVLHEESSKSRNYQGWQWHDVEIHPTKLIRLVTEGIIKVSLRTRQASYYLLRDPEAVKKALKEPRRPA